MADNELTLKERIKQEAKNVLDSTMWEGYANDILTGLQKNPNIQHDRPIWELVQNARDVSIEDTMVKILFVRKKNSFLFQHNGQPFTRKMLQSLIIQTSSKDRNDVARVGQYGTGFLTTHKFGLNFRLSGSLALLDGMKFFHFVDFIIKRSTPDKIELSKDIGAAIAETQQWGLDSNSWKEEPVPETIFEYLHNGDEERKTAEYAIKNSPKLTPFVLALNKHIESISFDDEVENKAERFVFLKEEELDFLEELCMYETTILHTKDEAQDEMISLFLLKSRTFVEEQTGESKFTVILPFRKVGNSLEVFYFDTDIPRFYLYLPLLKSKDFGCNFLIHSPCFTCDNDSRDFLMFRPNPQTRTHHEEENKIIISEANKALKKYFSYKYLSLKNAKLFCSFNIAKDAIDDKIGQYYQNLQKEWVSFFEGMGLAEQKDGDMAIVASIRVLNKELCLACEQDSDLLDAVYGLISIDKHGLVLPNKEELIFWSRVTDEWYCGKEENNPHVISMDKIVSVISEIKFNETEADLEWLHKLCDYFKNNKHSEYLNEQIIPNEACVLCSQKDLVRPVNFGTQLRIILKILVPHIEKKFVHPRFIDIVEETSNAFGNAEVKEALGCYFEKLSPYYDELKDSVINGTLNINQYTAKRIPKEEVNAILSLYKMLISGAMCGFSTKCFSLLSEYYRYNTEITEVATKDVLDVRKCYNTLLHDVLLDFTLQEDKNSARDLILRIVKELFDFKEGNIFLRNYPVYPDQTGVFKYASQLKKEEKGMLPRLKGLYNEICRNGNDCIEKELVDNAFSSYFIEPIVLRSQELADEIQKPFAEEDVKTIAKDVHQKQYLEIIEHFNSQEDGGIWKSLFSIINQIRSFLMLSVIDSPQKQESIFTIMKVDDEIKLQQIAELAKDPNFVRIVSLGKETLEKEECEKNDFEFKKELGTVVEKVLQDELNDILGENKLDSLLVDNEQGGQDLILRLNNMPVYYVEVKSRWASEKSVLMSTLQHKTSCSQKHHYALCVADMTVFMKQARMHQYPPFEQIESRLAFVPNIGELSNRLADATQEDEGKVHIAGGYHVLVPQIVIKKNGVAFREFIEQLKNIVKNSLERSKEENISCEINTECV